MKKRAFAVAAVVLFLCAAWWMEAHRQIVLTVGAYSGSYWGTDTGSSYQILEDAVALFEAQHPNVRVEYTSGIGTGEYSEWLAEQVLKGREPDVCFVFPEDFHLLAASGVLMELDGLMSRDESFDGSMYYPACLESGRWEEKQYALPYESTPTLMFVNKTLLERFGIEMPGNDWKWNDFYQICAKITAQSGSQPDNWSFGYYDYDWENALYSNGTSLFTADGSFCALGEGQVQEAVRFYKRLRDLNPGYIVTAKDFDLGRVAFRPFLFSEYKVYQPYPWRVKKYSNFEWDFIEMPAGPEGGNVSEIQTMLLGITNRSRQKELAWEFLKLLSGDETIQKELSLWSQGISPVQKVAEDEEILEALFEDTPGGNSFDREVIHEIMSTAVCVSRFSRYEQAEAMAERAVNAALESDQALDSQLLTAQREINIFLNQ